MALEIEHKYLVKDGSFRDMAIRRIHIVQGYLNRDPERTVRIRIADDKGFITVKGVTCGAIRKEYEYEIPKNDAQEMIEMCTSPVLEKYRYIVPYGGFNWEVDEFVSPRKGLITAEIELPSADTKYELPDFIGEDVTGNPAYYNSAL